MAAQGVGAGGTESSQRCGSGPAGPGCPVERDPGGRGLAGMGLWSYLEERLLRELGAFSGVVGQSAGQGQSAEQGQSSGQGQSVWGRGVDGPLAGPQAGPGIVTGLGEAGAGQGPWLWLEAQAGAQVWLGGKESGSAAGSWSAAWSCPFPKPSASGSSDTATLEPVMHTHTYTQVSNLIQKDID